MKDKKVADIFEVALGKAGKSDEYYDIVKRLKKMRDNSDKRIKKYEKLTKSLKGGN